MASSETQDPVVLSAHFADPKDADTIRRVAKTLRTSPSAFLRDAALREAAKVERSCPTCGQARKSKRSAKSAGVSKKSAKAEAAAA